MITRLRDGQQLETRSFALTDMLKWGYSGLRGTGSSVNEKAAKGVPALSRAARLRAEQLAKLQLCCYRGQGTERQKADNVWQSNLFYGVANDYQTRFAFWETVGESLAWRNKAYIWKNVDPISLKVVDWFALHPDQVKRTEVDEWEVTVKRGYVDPVGAGEGKYRVGPDTILFIRGYGEGGELEPPTAIEVFREAISGPVERQRHESRVWRRGTSLQFAVTFPQGLSKDQVDPWKDEFRARYEGPDGDSVIALGGGAQLTPIGMTNSDSDFVDMAHLTVEDAARIMGVPANLLGAQIDRPVPNLEQDLTTWFLLDFGPLLERIESALATDQQLFPNYGRSVYPRFESETFVRGDVQTEANILVSLVQAGIITPNEARAMRGLEDLPGDVGDIPQITPVGGAPNPFAAGNPEPDADSASY